MATPPILRHNHRDSPPWRRGRNPVGLPAMRVAGRHQPQSEAASRFLDHCGGQFVHPHLRALHQRTVTDQVDDPRYAARVRVHQVECRRLERHCRRPACHPEAMRDVRLHLLAVQRLERWRVWRCADELTHLCGGQPSSRPLSDEHDLEQLRFVGLQVRDDRTARAPASTGAVLRR